MHIAGTCDKEEDLMSERTTTIPVQSPTRTGAPGQSKDEHLARALGNRHIQLLAIGGAIGTGLFMGAGKTISLAGPVRASSCT